MGDSEVNARLRALPGVDTVMEALAGRSAAPLLAQAARDAVESARRRVLEGEALSREDVVSIAADHLTDLTGRFLRPVINATGVIIHTNLGRVPLGPAQLDAVQAISAGYSNLEYDLVQGRRGNRYTHASHLLSTLTGAEAALVVNNNAAAVLVTLAALCGGREVVISRGELIEIGGEFRMPDVMRSAGSRLVEVGTTNRTHLADYERAISENTAAILKVHPSNYRVVGFTAQVEARDLARLAKGRGVLFLNDLGSGLVGEGIAEAVKHEPPVAHALRDGADIVTFSGDKLLGGPQAGLILGRSELIARIAEHPLMRAIRVDKMTLAALEATIHLYLDGREAEIPLWTMLSTGAAEIEIRARAIAATLEQRNPALKIEVVPCASVSGGGSMPGAEIPSWSVALSHGDYGASILDAKLRAQDPPVLGRIDDDRLLLDLRTVRPEDDELVCELVGASVG